MASNSEQDDTNWNLCILCQDNKKKEKCHSTDDGRKKLSIQLMKFYNLGKLNHRLRKLCENKQTN